MFFKKQKALAIVAGCSRLGISVADELSNRGKSVIIIDKDEDSFTKLPHNYSGFTLSGDATDIDILKEAGIKEADIVLAATDNDNVNIMISEISSKIFDVEKVISRLYDDEKESIYLGFDIQIIYPSKLSIQEFNKLSLTPCQKHKGDSECTS